jgi:hypothetical protein
VDGAPAREPKYDDKKRQREEGGYPKETEHFVMLPEDVPEDVRNMYGPEPRSLRMMLPMEWDATDPKTGDELVFNRYNRAYGRTHGLRCKGTGNNAEFPGMASTTDKQWAVKIAEASGMAIEEITLPSGHQFRVKCLGQDCPKYLRMVEEEYTRDGGGKGFRMVKAQGVDLDAACKRVFILRAFLLDITTDPKSPNYCRVLGLAEIASSSYHTMINLQSDFSLMRAFTNGQTAGIPFRLVRVPTTTFKPSRQVHFVLKVSLDYKEVQRWAAIALSERFQDDEMRGRLRQIAASPLAPTWDSVKDLVPQALLDAPTQTGPTSQSIENGGAQGSAEGGAQGPQEGEGTRKLLKGEIAELKQLCGGRVNPDGPEDDRANPWKPETLAELRRIIALYNQGHGTAIARLADMTFDTYLFVKEYTAGVGSTARTTVVEGEAEVIVKPDDAHSGGWTATIPRSETRGADPTVRHPEGLSDTSDTADEGPSDDELQASLDEEDD